MRLLLEAPLAPAAVAAVCIAISGHVWPLVVPFAAAALGVSCSALALASADRPRRLCWWAAVVACVVSIVAPLVGPLPGFDLRYAGPLDELRQLLGDPLRRLIGEPESGIVRGILLGERGAVDADVSAAFARSGTAHLLAISGFNMTLVATGVGIVARGRFPPRITAGMTVVAVVLYSVLVGLAPSVVRAALMAAVAACGIAFGRRAATVNALALAVVVMVALDPAAITDVGFLLSATATAGLLFLGEPLSRFLTRLPSVPREGLATTLAATLPTLPIVAAVFGKVSVVSPLANLLAVPLFPPLMLAGAACAAIGAVSTDLARIPALLTYGLAFVLRFVVEATASLPAAAVTVPDGPLAGACYAALVAAALRGAPLLGRVRMSGLRVPHLRLPTPDPRRRAIAAGAVAVVLVAVGASALVATASPPDLRVRALDVGQGDAFLVEIAGRTLLIDGGPDPSRLLAQLGASLPPWKRSIDVVALTHAHADHANGLMGVLERYEIGLAIEPVGLNPGAVAAAWGERIARANVPRRAVGAGARVKLGDATLEVLSPDGNPRVDVPSLVLRLERGSFSMLFMGDATDDALADLLLAPRALSARVYVPPHHGAATRHGAALVEAVRPSAAVISAGAGNRYGHPTPETLGALGAVTTYRTDRDGTVEFFIDGGQLLARTHANGLPPPRRGSFPYAPSSR